MFVSQATDIGGNITLADPENPERTLVIPASADQATRVAQIDAFFGSDLSMPADVPMHQLRMFLRATNRLGQVQAFLDGLPDPSNGFANDEFEYAPTFVPTSALGKACQAALKLSDADYAQACRDMVTFTVDDYSAPTPGVVSEIKRFLLGG